MLKTTAILVCVLGIAAALPADPILRKLDQGLRYQHARDSSGQYHLVDTWMKMSDIAESTRYDPERENVYHLFTRANPTASQPLLINNPGLLALTNYNSTKRTIVLLHGWRDDVFSPFNSVLVPAFLAAEDVNVIVLDWSAGAGTINYVAALANALSAGQTTARFINWLNQASGSIAEQYHIVGHGLGGHMAGIAARNAEGSVSYVTGLDPALIGWINHSDRFQETDGLYTEVIHTNCGINGYLSDLGDVDFYPNGGESMPGCDSNACDHDRAIYYFGESLTSGGFTGRRCVNYLAAVLESCSVLPGRLNLGGITPKIGSSGVYWLETNAAPPFSQ